MPKPRMPPHMSDDLYCIDQYDMGSRPTPPSSLDGPPYNVDFTSGADLTYHSMRDGRVAGFTQNFISRPTSLTTADEIQSFSTHESLSSVVWFHQSVPDLLPHHVVPSGHSSHAHAAIGLADEAESWPPEALARCSSPVISTYEVGAEQDAISSCDEWSLQSVHDSSWGQGERMLVDIFLDTA